MYLWLTGGGCCYLKIVLLVDECSIIILLPSGLHVSDPSKICPQPRPRVPQPPPPLQALHACRRLRISQATYDLKDFVPKSFLTLQKTLSILPASALNLATSFVTVAVPCLAWVTSSAMVTGPWGLVPSPVRRQPGEGAQESPRKVGSRPLRTGSLFLHPCSKRSQDSSPPTCSQACNPQQIRCLWEIGPRLGMLRGPQFPRRD